VGAAEVKQAIGICIHGTRLSAPCIIQSRRQEASACDFDAGHACNSHAPNDRAMLCTQSHACSQHPIKGTRERTAAPSAHALLMEADEQIVPPADYCKMQSVQD
jgi:hypothetical protein